MIHRVAGVLVVALVSAGGSGPLAPVPQNRRSPRSGLVVGGSKRSVAQPGQHGVGDRSHHLSVALATVAVARPSLHVRAIPALVELREAGIVPDLPGQTVSVDANTRPNRRPRVVLTARAPPA